MRPRKLIQETFENLGVHPADGPPRQADNFRFGYWCGKAAALGWVLGETSTGAMNSSYTFDDFLKEQATAPSTSTQVDCINFERAAKLDELVRNADALVDAFDDLNELVQGRPEELERCTRELKAMAARLRS
jgi:hypothetical protein